MKRLIWMPIMALVLGMVLLTGCGEKAEQAVKEMGNKTQEASEKAMDTAKGVKDKVSDASQEATEAAKEGMESAVSWTKDKMDAYAGEMKEQLGNFDTQFDELSAKAGSLGDDAKEKFKGQFAALTEKKEAIAMKMEELQGASGEAWEKAKQELDKLMAELAQLYENMKKDLSAA